MASSALVALPALADTNEDIGTQLKAAAGSKGAGLSDAPPADPREIASNIFRVFAGLISMILIGINVYAGYLWMTAGGNEETVTKAKQLLKNGIIGLVIVLSAYSITIFAANLARGYAAPYAEGGILGLFGFR